MKSLPNVTLISYDNRDDPNATFRALKYCASLMQFAAVVLVCRVAPQGVNGETIRLVDAKGFAAAMMFQIGGIANYVATDFALCIQHDGYILDAGAWRDYWMLYDFIGSPWERTLCRKYPDYRVGNDGFCLKSKALMLHGQEMSSSFRPCQDRCDQRGIPSDVFTCQVTRPELEKRGMKFAPVDVAADFAWNNNIEEYPNGRPDAFGFHDFKGKTVPTV